MRKGRLQFFLTHNACVCLQCSKQTCSLKKEKKKMGTELRMRKTNTNLGCNLVNAVLFCSADQILARFWDVLAHPVGGGCWLCLFNFGVFAFCNGRAHSVGRCCRCSRLVLFLVFTLCQRGTLSVFCRGDISRHVLFFVLALFSCLTFPVGSLCRRCSLKLLAFKCSVVTS